MPRVWKFGDHINTDDILPGKYAPFMVGEDRFHTFAFAHLRPEFAKEVKPGDILVFGRNAGLGSSREYAPEALRKLGIQVVIEDYVHCAVMKPVAIIATKLLAVACGVYSVVSVLFVAIGG